MVRLKPGKTSALDIEEVLSGAADSHVHFLLLMSSNPSIRLIEVSWIGSLSSLGLPGWFSVMLFF